MPLIWFCFPVRMMLLFLMMNASPLLNNTSQPSSQNCPTLNKFADFNVGKTCAWFPVLDNCGRLRLVECVAVIVLPSSNVTVGPIDLVVLFDVDDESLR